LGERHARAVLRPVGLDGENDAAPALEEYPGQFRSLPIDIRDTDGVAMVVRDLSLVVHAAAQPSHDWGSDAQMDFSVNDHEPPRGGQAQQARSDLHLHVDQQGLRRSSEPSFDMPTVCFRGGCLTGPSHAGAKWRDPGGSVAG
jgi:hypothetical protein